MGIKSWGILLIALLIAGPAAAGQATAKKHQKLNLWSTNKKALLGIGLNGSVIKQQPDPVIATSGLSSAICYPQVDNALNFPGISCEFKVVFN